MSPPLRIILANSARRWIGEAAHVAMLYSELEELGHVPALLCRKGSALEKHGAAAGWRMLALDLPGRLSPKILSDRRRWNAFARDLQADLLHCHRGADHWQGLLTARALGIPLIRTRHVTTPVAQHAFNRWLYLKATAAVLSVSSAARAGFGPLSPLLPRGAVILSAVDATKFGPERRSEAWRRWEGRAGEDAIWFGFIGRLQRVKGQRYFIKAAAEVAARCPNARFLIAGIGSRGHRRHLEIQAMARGVRDRMRFEGRLEDLPEALASLDVGVIASVGSEGSSRVGLEMMASGLPLAATAVGGIPELAGAKPGEMNAPGARLAPPKHAGALAAGMLAWIADPAARQAAGGWNRARIVADHNPRQWAERIVEVYREVLVKKRN